MEDFGSEMRRSGFPDVQHFVGGEFLDMSESTAGLRSMME